VLIIISFIKVIINFNKNGTKLRKREWQIWIRRKPPINKEIQKALKETGKEIIGKRIPKTLRIVDIRIRIWRITEQDVIAKVTSKSCERLGLRTIDNTRCIEQWGTRSGEILAKAYRIRKIFQIVKERRWIADREVNPRTGLKMRRNWSFKNRSHTT